MPPDADDATREQMWRLFDGVVCGGAGWLLRASAGGHIGLGCLLEFRDPDHIALELWSDAS